MKSTPNHDRGQAIIFVIMALCILVLVVLWTFDVHKIIRVKNTAQNGGDAAALMAARWQAVTLNLVGDLNLLHAVALLSDDTATADAVTNIQARLLYTGPMIAFMASQQAAKNNGIFNHDDFTAYLQRHAERVRDDYPTQTTPDGEPLFPEPYAGCWDEYADMLLLVAEEGVAAGPDNMNLYSDTTDGHTLLMIEFYEAVAGRNWCWFHHHAPGLLSSYQDFFPCWWPPLPEIDNSQFINSEFFSLGLSRQITSMEAGTDADTLSAVMHQRGMLPLPPGALPTNAAAWYCYGGSWTDWEAMDLEGEFGFPGAGPVRPEYNYSGADAVVRIEADMARVTPGAGGAIVSNTITWTAAAKPFGSLGGTIRPNDVAMVLPAYTDVRLIPIDASSAPSGGGYNLAWREHIEVHLPEYMENGPDAVSSGCWYCRQLKQWERADFRQAGDDWLDANSDQCTAPGSPGGGPGGGRRHGH